MWFVNKSRECMQYAFGSTGNAEHGSGSRTSVAGNSRNGRVVKTSAEGGEDTEEFDMYYQIIDPYSSTEKTLKEVTLCERDAGSVTSAPIFTVLASDPPSKNIDEASLKATNTSKSKNEKSLEELKQLCAKECKTPLLLVLETKLNGFAKACTELLLSENFKGRHDEIKKYQKNVMTEMVRRNQSKTSRAGSGRSVTAEKALAKYSKKTNFEADSSLREPQDDQGRLGGRMARKRKASGRRPDTESVENKTPAKKSLESTGD
ncbi:hypothetical protein [Parendozoicomonas sp. Alg238-R29]|uniref:hypothetical protein n=1 Tax=Parendozoicomonas sp. Alg238-R29 TaxID=2993446 RepID=UPI00248D7C0A|nr:hypothetical protein [Parendozoicomonas sp. Alg238-R29]